MFKCKSCGAIIETPPDVYSLSFVGKINRLEITAIKYKCPNPACRYQHTTEIKGKDGIK